MKGSLLDQLTQPGARYRIACSEPGDAVVLGKRLGHPVVHVPLDRAEEAAGTGWVTLTEPSRLYLLIRRDEMGLSQVWAETLSRGYPNARVVYTPQPDMSVEQALSELGELGLQQYLTREMSVAERLGTTRAPLLYEPVEGDTLEELGLRAAAPISAVPTPWPTWNEACRGRGGRTGIAHGWHVVIGGIEGFGKTLLANNMADAAMDVGEQVAFHSLEMDYDELVLRQIAIATGVEPQHLEPGRWFRPDEWKLAVETWEERRATKGGRLIVNRDDLRSLAQVKDAMRYQWEVNGARFQIFDYAQLVWTKGRNKLDEIEEVSHTIRGEGKSMGISTVMLSQFTREAKKEREESPHNDALMGGSPLENDASQIVLLDHTRVRWYGDGSWDGWLLLSKNRHGPTIRPPRKPGIPIHFSAKTLRIRERRDDEVDESETVEGRRSGGRKR